MNVTLCFVMVLATYVGLARAQTAPDKQPAKGAEPRKALDLSTLCFNIRYDNPRDGEDRWDNRRDLVVRTIRAHNPDVLGMQEALMHQLEHVLNELPEYAYIGVGRDDGQHAGEYSPILYKKSELNPLASGTFWLSDTPEKPGSRTWGNRVVRICTWAHFTDKASGRGVWVYNAHLDHESQEAREKGLELIARRIDQRGDSDPVLLMGDFNADEENEAVRSIKGTGSGRYAVTLEDTFREAHPDQKDAGTFHGFKGEASPGKIDYIFADPGAEVVRAEIDRRSFEGRYPSDHFPVFAEVRWE